MIGAPSLEPLRPDLKDSLARFFELIRANGDEAYFHPHPLTPAEAGARCSYRGPDIYVAAIVRGEIVGYGMLRGWDEGHEVPSLGICLHPDIRGSGLARPLMEYLHREAWRRGADRIRLTVDPSNEPACRLFRSLGYELAPVDSRLVGYLRRPKRMR